MTVVWLLFITTNIMASGNNIENNMVVMLEGSDIPNAVAKPIGSLSLAAIIDGYMEPIPYQIDEYNEGGAIYFDDWDVPIDGRKNVFDESDKLLFVFGDAGERKSITTRYDGVIIDEISLMAGDGSVSYVYLVEDSRLRSDEQYVRYSAEEARVETDFYSITYNKGNHIDWDDFSVSSYMNGGNPFDVLKIRLSADVVGGLFSIGLDNRNVRMIPRAEKTGPIRTITQMEISLVYFGIPIYNISLQLHHFPRSLTYDARSIIPSFRRMFISNPKMDFSLEGNALFGTLVRTPFGPKAPAITDGKIDSVELAHREFGLNATSNWIWASSQNDLDFLVFFEYSGSAKQELSLLYDDNLNKRDSLERFYGQSPNIGYRVHGLPRDGYFGFVVNLHMSEGFDEPPELFTHKIRNVPDVSVHSINN